MLNDLILTNIIICNFKNFEKQTQIETVYSENFRSKILIKV